MKTGEVGVGRRDEGDEAADEGGGGEGEGDSLLRRVLVAAVSEATEPRLGNWSTSAVAHQPLEALPVVAVHGGVRVEGKPQAHGDAPATW